MPAAGHHGGFRPLRKESSTVPGMRARFRLRRFENGRKQDHEWPVSPTVATELSGFPARCLAHFVLRVSEVSASGRAPCPGGSFDLRPPRHEASVRPEEASSVHGPGNQPAACPGLSMDSQGPLRGIFRESAPLALAYLPSSTEGLLVAGRITQTSIASSALRSLSRWSESR